MHSEKHMPNLIQPASLLGKRPAAEQPDFQTDKRRRPDFYDNPEARLLMSQRSKKKKTVSWNNQ